MGDENWFRIDPNPRCWLTFRVIPACWKCRIKRTWTSSPLLSSWNLFVSDGRSTSSTWKKASFQNNRGRPWRREHFAFKQWGFDFSKKFFLLFQLNRKMPDIDPEKLVPLVHNLPKDLLAGSRMGRKWNWKFQKFFLRLMNIPLYKYNTLVRSALSARFVC